MNRFVLPAAMLVAAMPFTAAAAPAAKPISFGAAERHAAKQGVRADEIKIKGSTIEVEGRDNRNRRVELLLDRRTGEVLDRRFDD
ncbi:PepSY domain-containing protein [Sphingosinicella soli]|uniref:Putative membrane protein YkoI n=1 Tax=Sphingosinicella soli TaxID=333708 RepID=A0A7W7F551_9SPHN|nr:PepSY domain-containing protein [Sphingosinicella soli]MBB4631025.1 putative membrane protein YkoI [Sphingosinicella soli]